MNRRSSFRASSVMITTTFGRAPRPTNGATESVRGGSRRSLLGPAGGMRVSEGRGGAGAATASPGTGISVAVAVLPSPVSASRTLTANVSGLRGMRGMRCSWVCLGASTGRGLACARRGDVPHGTWDRHAKVVRVNETQAQDRDRQQDDLAALIGEWLD